MRPQCTHNAPPHPTCRRTCSRTGCSSGSHWTCWRWCLPRPTPAWSKCELGPTALVTVCEYTSAAGWLPGVLQIRTPPLPPLLPPPTAATITAAAQIHASNHHHPCASLPSPPTPGRYSKALVDPSLHPLGDELLSKFDDTERALLTVRAAACGTFIRAGNGWS